MNRNIKNSPRVWISGTAAFLALLSVAATAMPAMAQGSRQKNKNDMRNLGIGLGTAAGIELLRGKGTHALILGAGAAYSAKKYEDARKAQAKENRVTREYRYRNGRRVGYYTVRNGHRLRYHTLRG